MTSAEKTDCTGRMDTPPKAEDWVKLDLLEKAKATTKAADAGTVKAN